MQEPRGVTSVGDTSNLVRLVQLVCLGRLAQVGLGWFGFLVLFGLLLHWFV